MMSVLSAQSIRHLQLVRPLLERTKFEGCSYGLSSCGYDIRIAETIKLRPHEFMLASSIEYFDMPNFVVGRVHDKSTWARRGIFVQNTVIEPGWRGYLTLEISNGGENIVEIKAGTGIAQILFDTLDMPTVMPYEGKYQDQDKGPQQAIMDFS